MENYDVCVIGAGPGGYVVAIRSAQLGFKTLVIEKEKLGGVCLNVGCIPSKAMISATHFLHRLQKDASTMGISIEGSPKVDIQKMQSWKNGVCDKMSKGVQHLLKSNGVHCMEGKATFIHSKEVEVQKKDGTSSQVQARFFILATGSHPTPLPNFKVDEKQILSSTGALALMEIPKRLVVIGGGYIGLEIGSYQAKLGTQVSIIEASSSLLSGLADRDCTKVVSRRLQKNKVQVLLNAKAKSFSKKDGTLLVEVEQEGKLLSLPADKVVVSIGRRPNSQDMNLSQVGVELCEDGFVKVDAQRRTSIPHIFAIGDLAGQPMLAHKASYEGVLVAEILAGHPRVYDVKVVPSVIFTDPEIASVGKTEEECHEQSIPIKVGRFPFTANGRALSLMEKEGFVKVIAHKTTHVLQGIHVVGVEASNLISEGALAMEMGARLEDLALTIHPHPTLSETFMEAAEVALGHPIHIPKS